MTAPVAAPAPVVLNLLLARGVPDPLAALCGGSVAAIDGDHGISVFDAEPSDWTLTARSSWSAELRFDAVPWAAFAPHHDGVLLVNMTTCDVTALPAEVRMSLEMQARRYAERMAKPRFRLSVDSGHLRVATGWGPVRSLAIGAPYTVTAEAYQRHADLTFTWLSPHLRRVALTLAQAGPLSTRELLARVYPDSSAASTAALKKALSRLRHHPRITVTRLDDGRLTISASPS